MLGARLGNRANVRDDLIAIHTNTVITDRDRLRIIVGGDNNRQFAVITEQGSVFDRLEAQFVTSIRAVGNQLPKKNFLIAVQRVNHQLQQLIDLRLEGHCLGVFGHVLLTAFTKKLN